VVLNIILADVLVFAIAYRLLPKPEVCLGKWFGRMIRVIDANLAVAAFNLIWAGINIARAF
jgi:hypothetical protein